MTLKEELLQLKEDINNYTISENIKQVIFDRLIIVIKSKIKLGVYIIDLPLDNFLLSLKSEIPNYNYDKLFEIYQYILDRLTKEDIEFDNLSSFKDGKLEFCTIRIKI